MQPNHPNSVRVTDWFAEGIIITRLCEAGEDMYDENPPLANDVLRRYQLWLGDLKELLKDSGKEGFLYIGRGVPSMVGGLEIGDPKSLQSQILYRKIREATTDILKDLRGISDYLPKLWLPVTFDEQTRTLRCGRNILELKRWRGSDIMLRVCGVMFFRHKVEEGVSVDVIVEEGEIHFDKIVATVITKKAKQSVKNAINDLNKKARAAFGRPLFRWDANGATRLS